MSVCCLVCLSGNPTPEHVQWVKSCTETPVASKQCCAYTFTSSNHAAIRALSRLQYMQIAKFVDCNVCRGTGQSEAGHSHTHALPSGANTHDAQLTVPYIHTHTHTHTHTRARTHARTHAHTHAHTHTHTHTHTHVFSIGAKSCQPQVTDPPQPPTYTCNTH